MAADPLIPANSPFNYNLGINYDAWNPSTTVAADLATITNSFKLIKTYHDAAVGTANPTVPQIDPQQQQVITYVTGQPNLQLVMGTNESAVVQGGFGSPWAPGLMAAPPVSPATTNPYTDAWVQMIISAFGSTAAVQANLAMILLGNELDANGPPSSDPTDFANYQTWINQSFTNLSLSLKNAGLSSIPISTTIANYPLSGLASNNPIAVNTTTYILNNWSASWNNGSPIVFFNQYTPAGTLPTVPPNPPGQNEAESTAYGPVISYFQGVQGLITAINANAEPFVGETGYSTFWNAAQYAPTANPPGSAGPGSQAAVYQQIFQWLNTEYATGQKTIPLFAFQAFDVPSGDPVQAQYGIYSGTSLKPGITLPSWVSQPTNTQFGTAGNDKMTGSGANDTFYGGTGNDIIDGGPGQNTVILAGASASYAIKATAKSGVLVVQDKTGTDGSDQLTNIQNLQFSNTTIIASWITKAANLPADQMLKIVDLYTAGLNRAPDALGLDYYASRLADGAGLGTISKAIFGSPEAAPIFSSGNSSSAFVNLVYQNALGRTADAPGLSYWVKELDAGHLSRTDFVSALIDGARGPGGSVADAQYVANKTTVGAHFALTAGLSNGTWARSVEAGVSGTAASVTTANGQTDAFAAIAATPTTSELVVQIVGLVP